MASTDNVSIRLKLIGARDIVRGTTQASRSITGMQKKIEKTGAASVAMAQGLETGRRGVNALGRAIKWTSIAAGALAIYEIPRMLNAAVDLGEQQNKTKVVFEDSSRGILNWSKNTASALGISQREALEATGTFGNMLVPMGIGEKHAATMSKRLVTLAADMASFNNASPEETLEALRSGLAGETEPLRRFGVFLSADRIGLEAVNKGLAENYQELTAGQKARLGYNAILEDTVKAHGDFERTSDSLANQQRSLKAEFEEIEATIGEALIPVFSELADVASESMAEVSKILDNDNLDGSQKFERIMDVVDEVVKDGIEALEDAMPLIAETGAKLGGRLAISVGQAFLNSSIWGKLFIGAWLWKVLLGRQGTKVLLALGSYMATTVGRRFLTVVAPYFAAEGMFGSAIGKKMNGMKGFFGKWGGKLGVAFVAGLVTFGLSDANTRQSLINFGKKIGTYIVEGVEWLVNKGLGLIEGVLDDANLFAFAGVDAPNFGEVNIDPDSLLDTTWRYGPQANSDSGGGSTTPGATRTPRGPSEGGLRGPGLGGRGRKQLAAFTPRPIIVQTFLDGKMVAESTAGHAEAAAALK